MNSKSTLKEIAAIILAAGESRRLKGIVKQLIPWNKQPLIFHAINIIIESGLSLIHVILGANYSQINQAINQFPVTTIQNINWREGKATSIALGIKSLPEHVQAAMVFVVDQPFLSKEIIRIIMDSFLHGDNADIIAPYVGEIQANPVLFTRKTFPDLLKLKNEEGGKDIFSQFLVKKIRWPDKNLLTDIDTIEDYNTLSPSSNLPD